MVEFAIVLPMLVLLVFGTIEFGRAYNAQLSVTHAAREGVREYAITKDAAKGAAAARASAPALRPGDMGISNSACTSGQPATMTVTYPFQFFLPFVPLGPMTLTGQGVMRCGG